MKVTLAQPNAARAKADLLAVPVFAGPELGPGAEEAVAALGVPVAPLLEARGVSGKPGETAALPTLGRLEAAVLLLVGVGERAKVDAEVLRRAAAAVVREGRGAAKAVTTLAQALPADPAGAIQAVTEGALLAAYRFDKYKQAKANGDRRPAELAALALVPAGPGGRGSGGRGAQERALAAGQVRAAATNLARDLSNEPANALHPADLAAAARKALAGKGVTVKVKDEKALAREGFGGIVGVGQGAEHPPRLIELRYAPKGASGQVVLVGKGITFDSGGLSLKPPDSMKTMKTDMSGAAAVLATMSALADLDVGVAVTGYLASAENMPSGHAIRPGDVLTMKNGKTVEVLNTDAEGRLVRRHHRRGHPHRRLHDCPGQPLQRAHGQRRGPGRRAAGRRRRGRRADLAPAPAARVPQGHRERPGRPQERRRPLRRRPGGRPVPPGVRRRPPLGPPGHRRPRPGRVRGRLPGQGLDRGRRPDPADVARAPQHRPVNGLESAFGRQLTAAARQVRRAADRRIRR